MLFDLESSDPRHFSAARPAESGFDPDRLFWLNRYLQKCVESEITAGLNAAIIRNGHIAFAVSHGFADLQSNTPMMADRIFRVHSLTKPVVSVAAMTFLEEGRFHLTDPVADFLPEISEMEVFSGEGLPLADQAQPMTIADLMSHTSGLTYGGDPDNPVDQHWDAAALFRRGGTMSDILPRLCRLPLKYQPGARFEYGISHDVLGLVLERADAKPLETVLQNRVLAPPGMKDTSFAISPDKISRLTALYECTKDGKLDMIDPASSESRWAAPVTFEEGGGGLTSTIGDFGRFAATLLNNGVGPNGRLLSRKSVEVMTANRLSPTQLEGLWMPGYGYGLGFGVLMDPAVNANLGTVGEFTWAGSASTFFWVDPKEDIIGLLFSQVEPSSSHMMPRMFKALMYQALI